ncbi:MAG: hypothetical protein ABR583_01075 [Gaiellaceae bacterium]
MLDRWLPEYEFSERHEVLIAAPPKAVDRALREVSLAEVPVVRTLMRLRALPARLRGRQLSQRRPFVELMCEGLGGTVLLDRPGEELVVGLAGQFWKVRGDVVRFGSAEEFERYDRPDVARAVLGFELAQRPGAVRLVTVTRVHVADEAARRRFARYWLVVRPFSGLIRVTFLRAVKRHAEAYDRAP